MLASTNRVPAGRFRLKSWLLFQGSHSEGLSISLCPCGFLGLPIGSGEPRFAYLLRADFATRDFAISLLRLASVALAVSFLGFLPGIPSSWPGSHSHSISFGTGS